MDAPSQPAQHRWYVRLGMAAAMLLLAWLAQSIPFIEQAERATYDCRVQWVSGEDKPVPDVIVVEIDDHALDEFKEELMRWPWPRIMHAYVIDYVSAARVTGVDIFFSENPWEHQLDDAGDANLVKAVAKNSRTVLAAFFSQEPSDMVEPEAFERMDVTVDEAEVARFPDHHHVLTPFPELLEVCATIGGGGVERDEDGKLRSYVAVERFHDQIYPSLALAVAAEYLGTDLNEVTVESGTLHLGDQAIPLADDGSFLLLPHADAYPHISAADIIYSRNAERSGGKPEYPREFFRDKIVLLGVTAIGLRDAESTSLQGDSTGVFIHADAVDNLLRGICFRVSPPWVYLGAMALLAFLPAAFRIDRPRYLMLLAFCLLAVFLIPVLAIAITSRIMIMVPMMGPTLSVVFSCTGLGMLRWTRERAHRRHLETLDLAKQQITDMLVHDLKNTVAPIVMSLTMAGVGRRTGAKDEPADDNFLRNDFPEIVSTSANKLMIQINALLDIRRMQEGRMQLQRTLCSLHELLRRTEEAYAMPVRRAELGLTVDHQLDENTKIDVDPAVFDRILGNIIWHAVKYADPESTIRIGSRDAGDGRVFIYVANQGKIITDEVKQNLFTAFMTGPGSEQKRGRIPSTGLGLTFCKLAVEAHQGEIELLSPIPGEEGGAEVRLLFRAGRIAETYDGK